MFKAFVCLALLGAGATAVPALAAERLSFRELEYEQLRDPLTGSNPVFSDVHHTPQSQMAPALDALTTAIPSGTPVAEGEAILQRAGAHCRAVGVCTYRDLETVDEYLDDILWTVRLASSDSKVTGISADRAWQRH